MLSRPKWENYILSVVNMSKQDVLTYIKSHSDPSISASLVDGNGRSNRKFNWLFWIFDRTQDGYLDRKELGELHPSSGAVEAVNHEEEENDELLEEGVRVAKCIVEQASCFGRRRVHRDTACELARHPLTAGAPRPELRSLLFG